MSVKRPFDPDSVGPAREKSAPLEHVESAPPPQHVPAHAQRPRFTSGAIFGSAATRSGGPEAPATLRARFFRRLNALYFLGAPVLLSAIFELVRGDPFGMAIDIGIYALLAYGIHSVKQGLIHEAEYERRVYARPPGVPRKLIGAALIGLAVAGAGGVSGGMGWLPGLLLGALAAGASVLTFGMDPRRPKGEISLLGVTPEMVEEFAREAETRIKSLEASASRIEDNTLKDRLYSVTELAREIARTVEEDPNDLRRARKFLRVYLDGVDEAARKYAAAPREARDSDMYLKFREVLVDAEAVFKDQRAKLVENNRLDLDVELEVLGERLRNEGGAR